MRAKQLLISCLVSAAALLTSCGSPRSATVVAVPENAQAGNLTGMHDCEYQPADSKTKYAAECGTLVVPENRDKQEPRLIALPVVRIRTTGAKPAEPVFYLQGGPGQSNFSWAPPDWLLEKHDVVF